MRFKMENPDKVKNIVIGSYDGLNELYGPLSKRLSILENEGLVKIDRDSDKIYVSNQ